MDVTTKWHVNCRGISIRDNAEGAAETETETATETETETDTETNTSRPRPRLRKGQSERRIMK